MGTVYLIKWNSGDSAHVYSSLPDTINALQYHRGREATLFVIRLEDMSVKQHYIPLCS